MPRKIHVLTFQATLIYSLLAGVTLASTQTEGAKQYAVSLLDNRGIEAPTADDTGPKQVAISPNEPDSVKESFGDWSVECKAISNVRQCRLGQYQEDTKSGKTIVAIQITADENDGVSALLLLPLGLQIGKGVQFKLDDKFQTEKAGFATCVAVGCLVPVHLSPMSVEAVEHAGKLQIVQAVYGSDKPILFSISLKGFSPAYQRLKALDKTKTSNPPQ